jgi:2,5-diketo-D-gluconate reductase A
VLPAERALPVPLRPGLAGGTDPGHSDRMTNEIPAVTLNNGVKMPIIGFGVFQVPPEQTEQTVLHALEARYRALDTAASYGNEEAVGRAIAASGIPRHELFVTTKLWIQKRPGEESVRRAFETSRQRLGVTTGDVVPVVLGWGDPPTV